MAYTLPLKQDAGVISEFSDTDVISIVNGGTGSSTIAGVFSALGIKTAILITTKKTEILNNKIVLEYKPEGDILLNSAQVYTLTGLVEYDGITVSEENGIFYACFNEIDEVVGHAVVSYLTLT